MYVHRYNLFTAICTEYLFFTFLKSLMYVADCIYWARIGTVSQIATRVNECLYVQ